MAAGNNNIFTKLAFFLADEKGNFHTNTCKLQWFCLCTAE